MSKLVPPHGGKLTPVLLPESQRADALAKAKTLPVIRMSSRETSDLLMIGMGAFSPLTGFMDKANYESVVETKHLTNGLAWPLPITLSVTPEQAETLKVGMEVALVDDETDTYCGILTVSDKYEYDKVKECKAVFFTDDAAHDGVVKVMAQGSINVGGELVTFSQLGYASKYGDYYATPAQTRALFDEKGWATVAAFQTRNPLHRSHEFLCKMGNEICDGLFIHPIVGKLKEGDIPAETRLECYEVLLKNYFNEKNAVMKVYPMEMRYAGPSEAILHSIFRQNFGCSHILVGRDHAGVGDYYSAYQAQEIFDLFKPGELLCQPIKVTAAMYCTKCDGMTTEKTCPHGKEDHLKISGTKLRAMLAAGELPPGNFSRPEVLKILLKYYASKK
ncbi:MULTISPECIES: sulfate adenylyltransferase [Desulfosporosinus]|uniref:Sulfate adenylyltransferase n=2 Tax=Desulfosporosinus TaxID=79206 RepID=A0A1M6ANQ9_9FIRM|nr:MULTISPECIES: sulfate adenylyltransferase [Desulfosporosinus]MDA8223543.1 sulfate adenylyltransferase [Desulfitobacterium hafniense]MCO1602897.1 sulfate adenylyltransferase [Desulfosporosinus nitroreducens]MCO5387240.1 sulfate adenylyltransferase [Desulfosporosinus sp.]MDO0824584.1 sulfate adenylyltransferase [Desulfosporosinus nitroreducens]SHI37968.1 sulfate adenylyltransferase [Desulfosporosinus lacus DSM 15449]